MRSRERSPAFTLTYRCFPLMSRSVHVLPDCELRQPSVLTWADVRAEDVALGEGTLPTTRAFDESKHDGPSEVSFCAGRIRFDHELCVVRIEFEPGTNVTLEIAKEEISALKRLTGGKRYPVLCDFGNVASTDLAARAYYGGQETRSAYSAVAFLTPSPMTRAIGNVFLMFHGRLSHSRVRLFSSEREALEWLRTHGS